MTQLATSTSGFSSTVVALVEKFVIESLRANLPFLVEGTILPAKHVKGTNATFLATSYGDLTEDGAASIEDGQNDPTPEALSIDTITFTGSAKGRIVEVSDNAMARSPHNLATIAAEKVSRDILNQWSFLAKGLYAAATAEVWSGTSNTQTDGVATGDVLTGDNVKRAVSLLSGRNVPTVKGNDYVGLIHPYVTLDLQRDDDVGGWIDVNKYASPDQLLSGEIGRYAGVRFQESTKATIAADSGTASIDVYRTTIIGKDALYLGDRSTQKVIVTPPGGQGDPLERRFYVGWKALLGGVINDSESIKRFVAIESASSI